MILAIIFGIFVRPFIRRARDNRRRLVVEQRTQRRHSRTTARKPRVKFTEEELAYFKAHTAQR